MQYLKTHLLIILLPIIALVACQPSGGSPPADSAFNLTGTRWELTSLDGQTPLEGTRITLTIDEGIGGYAGCNGYGAPASWNRIGELTIVEIAMTAAACNDPEGVMEQETAYIDLLGKMVGYRVEGDQLELLDDTGQTRLTFILEPRAAMLASDLANTHWELVTMDGESPLEGSTLTLDFRNKVIYFGHAGCRDFNGEYEAQGDTISFSSMSMSGDESCLSDEALFTQEHTYIDYISATTTYLLSGDRLELKTRRGELLIFKRAAE